MERTYPPSNRWIRLKAAIKSTLETDSFPATATSHVRSENIDYVCVDYKNLKVDHFPPKYNEKRRRGQQAQWNGKEGWSVDWDYLIILNYIYMCLNIISYNSLQNRISLGGLSIRSCWSISSTSASMYLTASPSITSEAIFRMNCSCIRRIA